MQPFNRVTAIAAPLPAANVDTDVIMPKQYLKGVDRNGLEDGVLRPLRFDEAGTLNRDFILNREGWKDARFLVVGPNFGCGSSREHAVWGLSQLGVRALIGTSFAGIFFDNCGNNGLLAITLPEADIAALMEIIADPRRNRLIVDLPAQRIIADGREFAFEIEPGRKDALIQGLDKVGVTLQYRDEITSFEKAYLAEHPWLA